MLRLVFISGSVRVIPLACEVAAELIRRLKLLKVLERPEIPLHTNASENDISGGTMSDKGRQARDVMLGLMKTCRKLGVSFYSYIGDRLCLNNRNQRIPPLADLVAAVA
ncbi:hypothetical protein N8E89_20330 (plasmid) [Phyllobacterium sp. A18/5-2]|uniref:hypothetical protein n=1 Tax=Phyllobacterium sp. A18/5-2 TaxID=2978392 RepID=UPI0021C689F6|nr:hypothetical protein [Phyllobacterium sp. A18/5-2]UXN66916.1 hypothetical protein N8E89_20330 [Phyllobacterium sp. A18/5-2]